MEENNTEIKELPQSIEKRKPGLQIAHAIVLAGLIIALAIFVNNSNAKTIAPGGDKLDLVSEVTADDFVRGNPNAPITLIEYADFSCHFCAQYHPTLQKIVTESQGKVRWIYRHLPIFNIDAAIASSCVGKLGGEQAFWDFSDTMFAHQDKLAVDYYRSTALGLGIDEAAYKTCIADPTIKSAISIEFNQNKILLGFNATPYTVLIDKTGRKFSFAGALPYENVRSVIDTLGK
jgi:protein-disulfide isomerase